MTIKNPVGKGTVAGQEGRISTTPLQPSTKPPIHQAPNYLTAGAGAAIYCALDQNPSIEQDTGSLDHAAFHQ